jgi:hypothetical protein
LDWLTALYGALVPIVAYVVGRATDAFLGYFYDKTPFATIWKRVVRKIKIFRTRWHPIKIHFHFRVMLKPAKPEEVRAMISSITANISRQNKGQIVFSSLLWSEEREQTSFDILYHSKEYSLEFDLATEHRDGESETEEFEVTQICDSVAISLEASFPFNSFESALFDITSIVDLLDEQLKHNEFWKKTSNGLFTIEPTKADFTIADWVKEKKMSVSVTLKSKENIDIHLYPNKAEIDLLSLHIDGSVYDYLKATILEYYL